MKKTLKIAGIVLLALVGLLLLLFVLVRYVFREQAVAYLNDLQKTQRVELLRAAAPYAADPEADFRFTYRQDTLRAREIRTYFRLDTLLSPAASTWDHTLSLARFVARIPHANQKVQPERRDAIALWEYSRTIEPAFNCRLHAIMLHELLHASGIVSRFVTCLPADSSDSDCHVVNIVWLPERRKWAMVDSDQKAWIEGEDGVPLSLREMRERTLARAPMTVRPLTENEVYADLLSYWAKNLYWFECWEQTGYGKEPDGEGRTVALLPPGFEGFRLNDSTVRTTDDARFWAAPDTDTTL